MHSSNDEWDGVNTTEYLPNDRISMSQKQYFYYRDKEKSFKLSRRIANFLTFVLSLFLLCGISPEPINWFKWQTWLSLPFFLAFAWLISYYLLMVSVFLFHSDLRGIHSEEVERKHDIILKLIVAALIIWLFGR